MPGDVVEFGTWWGQSLVTFLNLRAIYEPYAARKIIGFDTFKGYPAITARDRASETMKVGGYAVGEITCRCSMSCWNITKPKTCCRTSRSSSWWPATSLRPRRITTAGIPRRSWRSLSSTWRSIEPTKAALEAIKDRLVPGSILAFDELNDPDYPGETEAVREILGLRSQRFIRSKHLPARTYAIIGVE